MQIQSTQATATVPSELYFHSKLITIVHVHIKVILGPQSNSQRSLCLYSFFLIYLIMTQCVIKRKQLLSTWKFEIIHAIKQSNQSWPAHMLQMEKWSKRGFYVNKKLIKK